MVPPFKRLLEGALKIIETLFSKAIITKPGWM